MCNPIFSIIMPVFNTNPVYLNEAVQSVKDQGVDSELIIVDDFSNTETRKTVRSFEADGIKTVELSRQSGVSAARNAGIEISKGKYILFLDSDDTLNRNALRIISETADETNADLILYRFSDNEKVCKEKPAVIIADTSGLPDMLLNPSLSKFGPIGMTGTFCVKRKAVKVQRFNENLSQSEDAVFFLKMLKKTTNAVFIDEELYRYRRNPESVCHKEDDNAGEKLEEYIKELEKIYSGSEYNYAVLRAFLKDIRLNRKILTDRKIFKREVNRFMALLEKNYVKSILKTSRRYGIYAFTAFVMKNMVLLRILYRRFGE